MTCRGRSRVTLYSDRNSSGRSGLSSSIRLRSLGGQSSIVVAVTDGGPSVNVNGVEVATRSLSESQDETEE